jgi:hypothetical protein
MRAVLFALVVLTGVACSKKDEPPPTCDKVVDHMLVVMKQGLTGHGDLELANKKQMVDQCEARKLSTAERKCMLAAKDLAALAACRPVPAAPAPTAPAGPVTVPGAGSGSGS